MEVIISSEFSGGILSLYVLIISAANKKIDLSFCLYLLFSHLILLLWLNFKWRISSEGEKCCGESLRRCSVKKGLAMHKAWSSLAYTYKPGVVRCDSFQGGGGGGSKWILGLGSQTSSKDKLRV